MAKKRRRARHAAARSIARGPQQATAGTKPGPGKRRRNRAAQDTTLINNRAAAKRMDRLERMVRALAEQVRRLARSRP
jgi:hypothetical protein